MVALIRQPIADPCANFMKTYRFTFVPVTLRIGGTPVAQLEMWAQGLGNLLDGLIMLVSFGFLLPGFALRAAEWRMLREIKRQRKQILCRSTPKQ